MWRKATYLSRFKRSDNVLHREDKEQKTHLHKIVSIILIMLFIQKSSDNRSAFNKIVARFSTYKQLSEAGEARDRAKQILLNEQRFLCHFCETKLTVSTATIEHFKPKAIYADLDRDYDNLFACCTICNNRKANHLFPAYIFDPRLDFRILVRPDKFLFEYGLGYLYQPEGPRNCILKCIDLDKYPITSREPSADHFPGSDYWAKVLNHYALDLLHLNNSKRLAEPRRAIYKTLMKKCTTAKTDELLDILKNLLNPKNQDYEEFISLKAALLSKCLRKRNANLSANFFDI